MFTGIIEGLGAVGGVRAMAGGARFTVDVDFSLEGTKIGDSIAVNGACLTAVSISGKRFETDVSPETLSRTTFGKARVGERVNVERALRLSDRLDGHLVSGHIDDVGYLKERKNTGNAIVITIGVPGALTRYMIEKGSVAVDGVSLTINRVGAEEFEVSIIPHTAALTTIGLKSVGDPVNIETDMIGKYIERLMRPGEKTETEPASSIDKAFLIKTGFIG
ncbi:MAG: riboflavin synthase [Desulfobacterales bacterium]|nr:riboflavin synthase [Desulfobacterales bacterium]